MKNLLRKFPAAQSPRFSHVLVVGLLAFAAIGATAAQPTSQQVSEADLPRIPPTEPAVALGTFRLAQGCQLELVAADPLVSDPVDACFDEFGRMYVAEMHGYPFSQEPTRLNPDGGGKPDAGIIRLLEDTDGDGRMDRSVVFADGLSWPTSVCCYDGGVFVLAPQYLYYLKDTDGDERADVRDIVLAGFGRDNVQSLANNLKWGLDNQIYFVPGRNPAPLTHRGQPLFTANGGDVRFDPRQEKFARVSGGRQFGHSFDDWGNRFVCSNSDHIQQVIFPRHYLERNPYLAVSESIRSIAADGASARVFRRSPPEPWRIIRQKWRAAAKGYRLEVNDDGGWQFVPLDPSQQAGAVPTEYPVGYFTSATGVTIYRGGAYPAEFRGNAFVGDVGGNLVHRKRLEPNGVAFSAIRADEKQELIRSSDNWFRPVNFVNAPDGTLYVLDMYRETIEHPHSIPVEIKQFLHLTSGSDRGRIYRLLTQDMQRAPPVPVGDLTGAELVAELESPNAWNRETAQRLLWQRQDLAAIDPLAQLVRSSSRPLARVHALYALNGLGALDADLIADALQDASPRVREHAVRLAEAFVNDSEEIVDRLAELCDDPDDRVRFQLAFTLGECDGTRSDALLANLVRDSRNGGDIRTALLSSVAGNAGRLAVELIEDAEFVAGQNAIEWVSELCLIVGASPDVGAAATLLAATVSSQHSPAIQQVVLAELGEGLSRRGSSVARLLMNDSTPEDVRSQVSALFHRATEVASDEQRSMEDRVEAIGLLAFADLQIATEHLPEFLTPQTPQALQRAAVASLSEQDSAEVCQLLLDGWRHHSPQLRRDVVDSLVTQAARIELLLDAVKTGEVGPADLERDKKQLLMNHPAAEVQARSQELFGIEANSDRAGVVAEHQHVLELDGNVPRGLEVFKKRCAVCHRVGEVGHRVAPDLASVQNKSAADLLIAILDPNREAQPNFTTYNVQADGRVYNGIIAAESAGSITLRRAEAKEDVILRDAIELLASTGMTLMPEGLEKDLSPQDLADVIALVKSIQPERP